MIPKSDVVLFFLNSIFHSTTQNVTVNEKLPYHISLMFSALHWTDNNCRNFRNYIFLLSDFFWFTVNFGFLEITSNISLTTRHYYLV